MDTITINFGDRKSKDVKVPESWNDLDIRTLLLFYETMFRNPGDELSATAFTSLKLITMAQHILGVDNAFLLSWEAQCKKKEGGLAFEDQLKQVVDACLTGLLDKTEDDAGGNTAYSVKFNLTNNPYPLLTQKSKNGKKVTWMFAPAHELDNITIYELAYTFQLYEAYLQTNEQKHAHELIACLYRPSRPQTRAERDSGWFGDRRQPLRRYEAKIEERAKKVAGLPVMVQRIILFWFASCREHIIKAWPQVFKQSDEGSGASGNRWGDLLLSLAETGVFGNLDQTADQHYSNALQLLTKRDNEARELEKSLKRSKK